MVRAHNSLLLILQGARTILMLLEHRSMSCCSRGIVFVSNTGFTAAQFTSRFQGRAAFYLPITLPCLFTWGPRSNRWREVRPLMDCKCHLPGSRRRMHFENTKREQRLRDSLFLIVCSSSHFFDSRKFQLLVLYLYLFISIIILIESCPVNTPQIQRTPLYNAVAGKV